MATSYHMITVPCSSRRSAARCRACTSGTAPATRPPRRQASLAEGAQPSDPPPGGSRRSRRRTRRGDLDVYWAVKLWSLCFGLFETFTSGVHDLKAEPPLVAGEAAYPDVSPLPIAVPQALLFIFVERSHQLCHLDQSCSLFIMRCIKIWYATWAC